LRIHPCIHIVSIVYEYLPVVSLKRWISDHQNLWERKLYFDLLESLNNMVRKRSDVQQLALPAQQAQPPLERKQVQQSAEENPSTSTCNIL